MSTLRELKDRIAKGEKVHIPNLAFYCALYDGELRCFNKNSNSKKPMELHLTMDEILSHKWEIYNGLSSTQIDAIKSACRAVDEITKVCNLFPFCNDCPFKSKITGCCFLREATSASPNIWGVALHTKYDSLVVGKGGTE